MRWRPLRPWHIVVGTAVVYGIIGTLIREICVIDPWLFAAIAFGGVLAL